MLKYNFGAENYSKRVTSERSKFLTEKKYKSPSNKERKENNLHPRFAHESLYMYTILADNRLYRLEACLYEVEPASSYPGADFSSGATREKGREMSRKKMKKVTGAYLGCAVPRGWTSCPGSRPCPLSLFLGSLCSRAAANSSRRGGDFWSSRAATIAGAERGGRPVALLGSLAAATRRRAAAGQPSVDILHREHTCANFLSLSLSLCLFVVAAAGVCVCTDCIIDYSWYY